MNAASKPKRKNRFAWLQVVVHIAAWIPAVYLTWAFFTNNLTVNPIQALTQNTGLTAITFLILALACTPLFTFTRFAPLLNFRRPLGLYAFMYAALHVSTFVGLDYLFDFNAILLDTADKRYIWVGLAAFLLLIPLAITSIRWFMIKMGKNWKRLHRLVYAAGVLAVFHFAWVIKGDVATLQGNVVGPLIAGSALTVLLAARIPPVRKRVAALGQNLFRGKRKEGRVVIHKHSPSPSKEP
jgi:methionine sulfoxide reductase heme-binding subunit